jgi:hypothetical protein
VNGREAMQALLSEQLAVQMRELINEDTFILAIINETEYGEFALCPHCNGDNTHITLEDTMNLSEGLAELKLCSDCNQVFIILSYPMIPELSDPIFCTVTLKEGEPPVIIEPASNDMVRHIMHVAHATKLEEERERAEEEEPLPGI